MTQSVFLNFNISILDLRLSISLYDILGLAGTSNSDPEGLKSILIHLHANLSFKIY